MFQDFFFRGDSIASKTLRFLKVYTGIGILNFVDYINIIDTVNHYYLTKNKNKSHRLRNKPNKEIFAFQLEI